MPSVTRDICITSIIGFGNNSSIAPISFENLFSILPKVTTRWNVFVKLRLKKKK